MIDIDKSKIRQLDFTLLLILNGLIRYRRTTVVAEELGLSQPAVSHALTRLRSLFSDPLFIRKSHGLIPTQRAIALAPYVDRMLQEAASAIALTTEFDPGTSSREFRVGMPEHLASIVAGVLFNKVQAVAPSVSFTIKQSLGSEAMQEIDAFQLDLAVGQFNKTLKDYSVNRVYEDKFVLVARENHREIKQRVSRALLQRLTHVAVSPRGERWMFTDDQLSQAKISRKIIARVPRFHTAFEIVRQSDAVVIAPERLASHYQTEHHLKSYRLPVALNPIEIVILRGNQKDVGLDWFQNLLCSCF